jgi:hypothetical protein
MNQLMLCTGEILLTASGVTVDQLAAAAVPAIADVVYRAPRDVAVVVTNVAPSMYRVLMSVLLTTDFPLMSWTQDATMGSVGWDLVRLGNSFNSYGLSNGLNNVVVNSVSFSPTAPLVEISYLSNLGTEVASFRSSLDVCLSKATPDAVSAAVDATLTAMFKVNNNQVNIRASHVLNGCYKVYCEVLSALPMVNQIVLAMNSSDATAFQALLSPQLVSIGVDKQSVASTLSVGTFTQPMINLVLASVAAGVQSVNYLTGSVYVRVGYANTYFPQQVADAVVYVIKVYYSLAPVQVTGYAFVLDATALRVDYTIAVLPGQETTIQTRGASLVSNPKSLEGGIKQQLILVNATADPRLNVTSFVLNSGFVPTVINYKPAQNFPMSLIGGNVTVIPDLTSSQQLTRDQLYATFPIALGARLMVNPNQIATIAVKVSQRLFYVWFSLLIPAGTVDPVAIMAANLSDLYTFVNTANNGNVLSSAQINWAGDAVVVVADSPTITQDVALISGMSHAVMGNGINTSTLTSPSQLTSAFVSTLSAALKVDPSQILASPSAIQESSFTVSFSIVIPVQVVNSMKMTLLNMDMTSFQDTLGQKLTMAGLVTKGMLAGTTVTQSGTPAVELFSGSYQAARMYGRSLVTDGPQYSAPLYSISLVATVLGDSPTPDQVTTAASNALQALLLVKASWIQGVSTAFTSSIFNITMSVLVPPSMQSSIEQSLMNFDANPQVLADQITVQLVSGGMNPATTSSAGQYGYAVSPIKVDATAAVWNAPPVIMSGSIRVGQGHFVLASLLLASFLW